MEQIKGTIIIILDLINAICANHIVQESRSSCVAGLRMCTESVYIVAALSQILFLTVLAVSVLKVAFETMEFDIIHVSYTFESLFVVNVIQLGWIEIDGESESSYLN